VRFRGSHRIEGQSISYDFSGTVDGDKMAGAINLGEYGDARWSAQRHQYGGGGRRAG
jgi:hypothetical protein